MSPVRRANGEVSERFKEVVLKTTDGDEPSVDSNSTLPAICGSSSMVEHRPSKSGVASSSLVYRSKPD